MKLLYVHGNDYAALTFEQEYGGRNAAEIIDILENPKLGGDRVKAKYEEQEMYLEIIEVGEVDPRFRQLIRKRLMDYDHSKDTNFYFEDEIIMGI